MVKVLFVCLGNICRSPLAEAIFKHKIMQRGIQSKFEASSCGTADYHVGEPPDLRTIKVALKNGIAIEHLGRQFATIDLEYYDYILAMDKSNYFNILRHDLKGAYSKKVFLMRDFNNMKGAEVPDPYYGGDAGFQEVFDILDQSIEGFIETQQRALID